MIERHCHRCGSVLHVEAEGALLYCSHCGAPQVVLSEELQEQAAQQLAKAQDSEQASERDHNASTASGAIVWRTAILISLAVAGALSLLTVVLPPMAFLVWAWAPVAPAIVIALYAARERHVRFTASTGARIGAICGVLISAGLALINMLELDVMRFGVHKMDAIDGSVNNVLTQVQAQTAAQSGPAAEQVFQLLKSAPEFRVGFFLTGLAFMAVLIFLLAIAGGAFAGSVRRRRQAF